MVLPVIIAVVAVLTTIALAWLYGRSRRVPMTLEELGRHVVDGDLMVSVGGSVFDVSEDGALYGANGPFAMCPGHDISLSVAKRRLEPSLLNGCARDVSDEERGHIQQYVRQLRQAYPEVGSVFPLPSSTHPPIPAGMQASTPLPASIPRVMSMDDVLRSPGVIAVRGLVFDVTSATDLFGIDGPYRHLLGSDASMAFASHTGGVGSFSDMSYDAMVRLDAAVQALSVRFPCVGVATDSPASPAIYAESPAITTDSELHRAIDDGDYDRAGRLLAHGNVDVNAVCSRTSLTPLHKLVEADRADLVQMALVKGADPMATAALYDNETPLQMAHRFHHSTCVEAFTAA
ncbi:Ankyrin repeat domain-containing protein [Plasmodiophora brassicae]